MNESGLGYNAILFEILMLEIGKLYFFKKLGGYFTLILLFLKSLNPRFVF